MKEEAKNKTAFVSIKQRPDASLSRENYSNQLTMIIGNILVVDAVTFEMETTKSIKIRSVLSAAERIILQIKN